MASAPQPPPPASSWAGLPRDVLWDVFLRIGQREVLLGAGLVCSAWRRLARDEPVLWRRIDLTSPDYDGEDNGALGDDDDGGGDWLLKEGGDDYCVSRLFNEGDVDVSFWCRCYKKIATWKARARAAVDRSAGQCEAFSGRADDEVLRYLAGR